MHHNLNPAVLGLIARRCIGYNRLAVTAADGTNLFPSLFRGLSYI